MLTFTCEGTYLSLRVEPVDNCRAVIDVPVNRLHRLTHQTVRQLANKLWRGVLGHLLHGALFLLLAGGLVVRPHGGVLHAARCTARPEEAVGVAGAEGRGPVALLQRLVHLRLELLGGRLVLAEGRQVACRTRTLG